MTDAEMVRLAAEKVMGWEAKESWTTVMIWQPVGINCLHWNPLTSDADCWMLVEKLQEQGWGIRVAVHVGGYLRGTSVRIYRYEPFIQFRIEEMPDRRRAIVLACLRAVGVDV